MGGVRFERSILEVMEGGQKNDCRIDWPGRY